MGKTFCNRTNKHALVEWGFCARIFVQYVNCTGQNRFFLCRKIKTAIYAAPAPPHFRLFFIGSGIGDRCCIAVAFDAKYVYILTYGKRKS